ncbi:hypothetical protein [Campylobacter coli]|uniref:hypothetical protein n=1 Tax=Campylobacter coli TaxID=195 RepID=UPI0020BFA6D6|nr:hypothetical protein [Campylobacter coli]MCL4573349.1 hypothetical protein [Campylobacter coli]MCL4575075.1 hypothetical protein [Campylobacter coli]
MQLEKTIETLNDYAFNLGEDKEFIEFAKKLKMFSDSIKNDVNINEKNVFIQELDKKMKEENFLEENYKDLFFNQAKSFVNEYENNGFIMFDNFQKNFIKEFNNKNLSTEKKILNTEKDLEEELITLLSENKENMDIFNKEKADLLNKKIFLEKQIIVRSKKDEFDNLDFKTYNAQDLINFINNKEQIEYPFPKEKTLEDENFIQDFRKELKNFDTKTLKEMIEEVKRKNEILKEEIKKISEEKEKIIKEIEAQTELNQNLSALKNADENILSDVKEVLEKENTNNLKDEKIKNNEEKEVLEKEQEINHKKRA